MEQNADTSAPAAPAVENKQKSGNGLKIATAIACIVAVCGIGFGVYGMMQSSQKDSQISDLKVQIKEDDGTITTIDTPEIETTTNGNTTIIITDTTKVSGGPFVKDRYFYIPEWGLKFKIPEELSNYGYSVDYDENTVGSKPIIGFTAMLEADIQEEPHFEYYDNIGSCAIVNVSKEDSSWDTFSGINGIIKEFNDYKLLIWNYTSHGNCSYNLNIDKVQEKLQTMFSNPEDI